MPLTRSRRSFFAALLAAPLAALGAKPAAAAIAESIKLQMGVDPAAPGHEISGIAIVHRQRELDRAMWVYLENRHDALQVQRERYVHYIDGKTCTAAETAPPFQPLQFHRDAFALIWPPSGK